MLIPGALFGYFAGYSFWFPKVFGFALNEKWGKRAFWLWASGFYLAFMPLYVLGFMGMPRRLEYYTNPAWQPWLVAAAVGAAFILAGIVAQAIQLLVSIRQRESTRDVSGDYWRDGRSLEWSTASPPPVYNFAQIPVVADRDAFTAMKRNGSAAHCPASFADIHMPSNTPAGFIIGVLAFLLGFGLIWHIWWLAGIGAVGILITLILRATQDDPGYIIPAAQVQAIEMQRSVYGGQSV